MNQSKQDKIAKLLSRQRKKIDALDDKILRLLGARFKVVNEVARIKIKNSVRIVQRDRVRKVKERNAATAKKYGISPDLVRTIYTLIIDEAHNVEHAIEKKIRRKKT